MTSTKNQVGRLIAAGAFAVAAVAAPFAASALTTTGGDGSEAVALPPGCLAWFGNQEDGKCLAYSNGSPVSGGTPGFGIGSGGIYSRPMLPGATIDQPLA